MSPEVTLNHVLQAVVELTAHLNQFEKRTSERFDKLENRFDILENRFDKLEKRMDKLEDRFDKLENRMDTIDEKLDKIDTKFMILNDRIVSTEADVFKLKKTKLI